jgi:hypothetical protein
MTTYGICIMWSYRIPNPKHIYAWTKCTGKEFKTVHNLNEQVDIAVDKAVIRSYLQQDISALTEIFHGFLSSLEKMPVLIRPWSLPSN